MKKEGKPLHHHLLDYFFPHERNNHRPNIFSAVSILFIVLAIGIFEMGYVIQTKFVFLETDFLASVLPGALVALANQDRAISGISDVTEDVLLDKAAQAAAEDMATNGYFAHVSPDGKTPWYWLDSVGYQYSYAGENLAVNFTDSSEVETAWMNSPTHRANIEKPQYTRVGIGVANGMYEGSKTTFVVQFFATPAVAKVAIATATQNVPTRNNPSPKPTVIEQEIVVSTSTVPAQVLGTEIGNVEIVPTVVTPTPIPETPRSIGWFESLLTSPLHILITILTTLFAITVISFAIVVIVRGRNQHPSVAIGSMLILVFILVAILITTGLGSGIQLSTDGQAASVYLALP